MAAPVGAVVLIDIYFFPRIQLISNLAEIKKLKFNLSVALTWVFALGASYGLFKYFDADFYFFMAVPGWIIARIVYVLMAYLQQKVFMKTTQTVNL